MTTKTRKKIILQINHDRQIHLRFESIVDLVICYLKLISHKLLTTFHVNVWNLFKIGCTLKKEAEGH